MLQITILSLERPEEVRTDLLQDVEEGEVKLQEMMRGEPSSIFMLWCLGHLNRALQQFSNFKSVHFIRTFAKQGRFDMSLEFNVIFANARH